MFVITALVIIFGSVYNLSGVEIKKDSVKDQLREKRTVSPTALESLSKKVKKMGPLNSFQISYRGKEIVEDYYRGINEQTPVNVKSVSKSILSALVGIALSEGIIKDLDQPAANYLPELFESVDNRQKKNITLRHLLLMSSGLRSTSEGRYGWWVGTANWRRAALSQPLVDKPGSSMSYSTGDSHLLASVLEQALGREDLLSYARRKLFRPLGEDIYAWQKSPEGARFGGNNLSVYPPFLLKFGELYLNNGRHNGRQVVPENWIRQTFRPVVNDTGNRYSYGYYWWAGDFGGRQVKFAWGHAGQFIFIVPAEELVVAFTAERDLPGVDYTKLNEKIFSFMSDRVIPLFAGRRAER